MIRRCFVWAAILGLFFDQVTKLAVYGMLAPGESVRLAGNFLRIIHADNPQGVFGLSFGPQFLYYVLPAIGSILVVVFALRARDRWSATAFGLILGGAVGNLVDRIRLGGHVIDFIDVGWRGWRWYVFNVADACVVCGIIILLGREFLFPVKAVPPAVAAAPEPDVQNR